MMVGYQSITTRFINQAITDEQPVAIYLTNGVRLRGKIVEHDHEALLLHDNGTTQLVLKAAVSTVMPTGAQS